MGGAETGGGKSFLQTESGIIPMDSRLNEWEVPKNAIVNCRGWSLNVKEAEKDLKDKKKKVVAASIVDKKQCETLVESMKVQLASKVELLSTMVGSPYDIEEKKTCTSDLECGTMTKEFMRLHRLVFNEGATLLNDDFQWATDVDGYGTAGSTFCTDFKYCANTDEELKIAKWGQNMRQLQQDMMIMAMDDIAGVKDQEKDPLKLGGDQFPPDWAQDTHLKAKAIE